MSDDATSPLVEAQIERALAPVRDLVPAAVLGEMRRLLEDMLTAHPPVARLATRLGPNPRAVTQRHDPDARLRGRHRTRWQDREWSMTKPGGASLSPEREDDIRAAMRWVRVLARTFVKRHGHDFDELVSVGHAALVDAATRFDSSAGAKFDAFAMPRVRGEMLDSGAKDRTSAQRALLKAVNAAGHTVQPAIEEGNPFEDDDAATLVQIEAACDAVVGSMLAAFVGGVRAMPPDEAYAMREEAERCKRALDAALDALGDPDRGLIEGVHCEGRTFVQIAAERGVSTRTIQRHHHDAAARLVSILRARGVTGAVPMPSDAG